MITKTFQGGVALHEEKSLTDDKRIKTISPPGESVLPLSQHIGVPCDPIVNIGDTVKTGQKIAEAKAFVSSPIHASISGTIKAIDMLPHPITGKQVKSIMIEADEKDEKIEIIGPEIGKDRFARVREMKNEKGVDICDANPGMKICIKLPVNILPGDIIRKKL